MFFDDTLTKFHSPGRTRVLTELAFVGVSLLNRNRLVVLRRGRRELCVLRKAHLIITRLEVREAVVTLRICCRHSNARTILIESNADTTNTGLFGFITGVVVLIPPDATSDHRIHDLGVHGPGLRCILRRTVRTKLHRQGVHKVDIILLIPTRGESDLHVCNRHSLIRSNHTKCGSTRDRALTIPVGPGH